MNHGSRFFRKEGFVAADERAKYPAGHEDRVVYLDIQIAIAGGFAAGPRRPFGSADGQDQATGDEHRWPHLWPIRRLDEPPDFAFV